MQGKDSLRCSIADIFDFSLQSVFLNSPNPVVNPERSYPRVSGIHTLPGMAGASAERSAPHFSQSSFQMTGGDPPIL